MLDPILGNPAPINWATPASSITEFIFYCPWHMIHKPQINSLTFQWNLVKSQFIDIVLRKENMKSHNVRHAYSCMVVVIFIHLFGCASTGPVTSSRIRDDMASIKKDFAAGKNIVERLKNKRIGKTGFYYIVNFDGTVVFHPQSALIGSSFKDHWFIEKLAADRSGCMMYRLGNRTHVIFFDQINDSEILCFSILADELRQPPLDCQQLELQ
jgi:hypothetical protein